MNIRMLREQKGITQQKLADDTGIDRALIARYENGSRKPPIDNLVKLASYFEVSTDEVIGVPATVTESQDEIWQLREQLRRDPERRTLFDAAKNVRKEDILTAVKILDALKGGDDGEPL